MTREEDGAEDSQQRGLLPKADSSVSEAQNPEIEANSAAGVQDAALQIEVEERGSLKELKEPKELKELKELKEHAVIVSEMESGEGEEGPLLQESRSVEIDQKEDEGKRESIECRICQEEDDLANLDTPCACTGSVKYAHPKCVQRWSNEKGDAVCEICHQPYKGYTAVPRPPPAVTVPLPLEFTDEWTLAGQRLSDPRLLHQYTLDVDYNEYEGHASTTAWCRSAALIFMALLLLRHALGMIAAGGDDDETPAIFTVFLLKAIGFILPCYIMARAISVAQRRRQQQDAMAYFVQQGHVRGVPIVVAPRRLPEGVV